MNIWENNKGIAMIRLTCLLICIILQTACNTNQVNVKDTTPVIDHYRIGEQAYKSGEYKRAKIHFNKIISKQPGNIESHFRLGNIALREGNYAKASRHYQEVLIRKPAHKKAHYNLATALLVQAENHLNYFTALNEKEHNQPAIVNLLVAIKKYYQGAKKDKDPLEELADILSANNK